MNVYRYGLRGDSLEGQRKDMVMICLWRSEGKRNEGLKKK